MHALIIVARFVHIFCGIYWVGAVFFINIFLGPSLQSAGPAGMSVMKALSERKYFEFTIAMAALSILAGFVLVWQDSAGFDPMWFRSSFGMAISIGMTAAILAFLVGIFFVKPILNKLGAVGMQLAQATGENRAALTMQMDATRKQLMSVSMVAMLLLLIVVGTMAIARYL